MLSDNYRTWYVIFRRQKVPFVSIWQRLLNPMFGHVTMASRCGNRTIVVNPRPWGTVIEERELDIFQFLKTETKDPDVTAVVQAFVQYGLVPRVLKSRGIITCVSLAKSLLSLQGGRFIITPKQLYEYLLIKVPNKICESHVNIIPVKGQGYDQS